MAAALDRWSARPSAAADDEDMTERMLTKTHDSSPAAAAPFRRISAGAAALSLSSPAAPNPRKWQRIGRNFAGALAAIRSSLNLDSAAAVAGSSSSGNDKLFWGSFIRNVTQLYPGSQLPEHLITSFRSHFDSLPTNYSQAGFDMKDVLLHVRLIERATSENNWAIDIQELVQCGEDSPPAPAPETVFKLTFASSSCSLSWPVISAALAGFSIRCKKIQIFEKKGLIVGAVRVAVPAGNKARRFKAHAEAALLAAAKRTARLAGAGVKLPFGLCGGCKEEESSDDYPLTEEDEDDDLPPAINNLPVPLPERSVVVSVDEWQTVDEEIRRWILSSEEVEIGEMAGPNSFRGLLRRRSAVWVKRVSGHAVELRRDLLQLMSSRHKSVIRLVGFLVDGEHGFCVVTKMMEGGSVSDMIRNNGRLSSRDAARIALDVAEGLEFVNGHGVAYRDLNTQRILLDGRGNACLGDPGVASPCCGGGGGSGEAVEYETAGFRWLAPEIIAGDPESVRETTMSNVYSLGMVVWEMVAGEAAYSSYSPVQAAVGIAACGLRPEVPNDCPPFLRTMMNRCWNECPSKRPKLPEIVSILVEHCGGRSK